MVVPFCISWWTPNRSKKIIKKNETFLNEKTRLDFSGAQLLSWCSRADYFGQEDVRANAESLCRPMASAQDLESCSQRMHIQPVSRQRVSRWVDDGRMFEAMDHSSMASSPANKKIVTFLESFGRISHKKIKNKFFVEEPHQRVESGALQCREQNTNRDRCWDLVVIVLLLCAIRSNSCQSNRIILVDAYFFKNHINFLLILYSDHQCPINSPTI